MRIPVMMTVTSKPVTAEIEPRTLLMGRRRRSSTP